MNRTSGVAPLDVKDCGGDYGWCQNNG